MKHSKTLIALSLAGLVFSTVSLTQSCSSNQPAEVQMEDAGVTTKVKSKFAADPEVKGRDISVETQEGVVYLTGRVDSQYEKNEAENLAKHTDGVKKVVNNIKVGPMPKQ